MDITHGTSTATRWLAALLGLPPPTVAGIARVRIERRCEGTSVSERWIRTVSTVRTVNLTTRQIRTGDQVAERIGPLELRMRCHITTSDVWFLPIGAVLVLGRLRVRLPSLFAPQAIAHAWSSGADAFDVEVSTRLPLVGTILSYRGHFTEVEQ